MPMIYDNNLANGVLIRAKTISKLDFNLARRFEFIQISLVSFNI